MGTIREYRGLIKNENKKLQQTKSFRDVKAPSDVGIVPDSRLTAKDNWVRTINESPDNEGVVLVKA
jgi:hypothetical protein